MLRGLNFSCCDIWLMLPRNNLYAASFLLRAGENCIVEAANTPQQFASGMHVPDFSPRKGAMATQMFWRAHDKLSRGPQQSILTHLRTYIIFWYADTHTHTYMRMFWYVLVTLEASLSFVFDTLVFRPDRSGQPSIVGACREKRLETGQCGESCAEVLPIYTYTYT